MSLFDGKAAEHRPAESLAELAAAINAEFRRTVESARQVGELLVRAKSLCKRGQWIGWLEGNVKMSRQHAARFMRLARNWSLVSAARTLDDAMRTLAEATDDSFGEPNGTNCSIRPPEVSAGTSANRPAASNGTNCSIPPQKMSGQPSSSGTPWIPAVPGANHRPNDHEQATLLIGAVPRVAETSVPGERLVGPALTRLVAACHYSARKLREDVDLFHAHYGGFPGPDDVRPIVAALAEAERECRRREGTGP